MVPGGGQVLQTQWSVALGCGPLRRAWDGSKSQRGRRGWKHGRDGNFHLRPGSPAPPRRARGSRMFGLWPEPGGSSQGPSDFPALSTRASSSNAQGSPLPQRELHLRKSFLSHSPDSGAGPSTAAETRQEKGPRGQFSFWWDDASKNLGFRATLPPFTRWFWPFPLQDHLLGRAAVWRRVALPTQDHSLSSVDLNQVPGSAGRAWPPRFSRPGAHALQQDRMPAILCTLSTSSLQFHHFYQFRPGPSQDRLLPLGEPF